MTRFRLDRFLTLCLFCLYTKDKRTDNNEHIPILMYHSISDKKETSHPYYQVNTTPAVFEAHLQHLHENGYNVINLHDLEIFLTKANSRKSVVITFDDGFRDFYTNAFPLLNKYSFKATVFLPVAFIKNQRTSFKGKECMTWNEIRELNKQGIHFGSHTVNHPQLKHLAKKNVESEIASSKKIIEENTSVKVMSFSYPFAFPQDDKLFIQFYRKTLLTQGYSMAVTTVIGRASVRDDLYFLKRIPVNNCDDLHFFQAKLYGAYDWLAKPQYFVKLLKRRTRKDV